MQSAVSIWGTAPLCLQYLIFQRFFFFQNIFIKLLPNGKELTGIRTSLGGMFLLRKCFQKGNRRKRGRRNGERAGSGRSKRAGGQCSGDTEEEGRELCVRTPGLPVLRLLHLLGSQLAPGLRCHSPWPAAGCLVLWEHPAGLAHNSQSGILVANVHLVGVISFLASSPLLSVPKQGSDSGLQSSGWQG